MKKGFKILILLFVVVLLSSCTKADKPIVVTEDVLDETINYDGDMDNNIKYFPNMSYIDVPDDLFKDYRSKYSITEANGEVLGFYKDKLVIKEQNSSNIILLQNTLLAPENYALEDIETIHDIKALDMSERNGNILCIHDDKLSIYNIEDKSFKDLSIYIKDDSAINKIKFIDKEGKHLSYMDEESDEMVSVDIGTRGVVDVCRTKISSPDLSISPNFKTDKISNLAIGDKRLYFYTVNSITGKETLHGLSRKPEAAPSKRVSDIVIPLLDEKDIIHDYQVLKDENIIIFNGIFEGKSGLYLFNNEDNSIRKIADGGENEKGRWMPSFAVSTDEKYIIYSKAILKNKENYFNIYISKISDMGISKGTLIKSEERYIKPFLSIDTWDNGKNNINLFIEEKQNSTKENIEDLLKIKIWGD